MLKEIAELAELLPSFRMVPFPRAIIDLEVGNSQLTAMFKNDEIMRVADPIERISELNIILIGKKGTVITEWNDLKGKTIGTVRAAKYSQRLSKDDEIIKYETLNYEMSINMLLLGRLDYIVVVESAFWQIAHDLNFDDEDFGQPYEVTKNSVFLFCSKIYKDIKVKQKIINTVKEMRRNNRFKEIEKKYLVENY